MPARATISNFLRSCLLLLCLLAPSAWMIATLPPLWRDSDAYIQATENPLLSTFWGFGPAYCYAVKVPLFAGEQLERLRRHLPASRAAGSSQPSLTDSGVWLLIAGQHLALCGAAFYFIVAVTRLFWVRLALALTWASNALAYTFAHCVGSETLSLIFIILLVGKALRLIRSGGEPGWRDWYGFAIALCVCILSRHLNLILIGLLPATFLLSWIVHRAMGFLASDDRQKIELRQLRARDLRQAVIATAIGIACFAMTNLAVHKLARKTRFHPHSRIGFTFLWRLHFLQDFTPEARAALLHKVAARTHSPEVRKLLALLEQMLAERADLITTGPLMQRAIELFNGPLHWEELDRALNQMAFAFLLPPTTELLHAARTDFVAVLRMPSTEISSSLFATTAYYFDNKDQMPGCAELVTFRGGANAEKIWQLQFQHRYFRLWEGLSYNRALVVWVVALSIFVVTVRRRKLNPGTISAFGIALAAIGITFVIATCVLDEFSPRFALPMWQLLLLSFYIFLGKTADLVATDIRRSSLNLASR
ncbi:MAG: hypothetical protein QOK24_1692 [Verrucomicrobiota bacterium]|jgi:hypothetical protein